MIVRYSALLLVVLCACTKLPDAGWYKHTMSGEKVYVVMTGSEDQVKNEYGTRFTKGDFVEAFSKTRSSQFLNEGRPKYYAVIGDAPDRRDNLTIMALEILERDYVKEK